jgi:hypothetical protein
MNSAELHRWISIEERLPDHTDDVPVWGRRLDGGELGWWKGKFRDGRWSIVSEYHDSSVGCDVTHWIDIQPPEGAIQEIS